MASLVDFVAPPSSGLPSARPAAAMTIRRF